MSPSRPWIVGSWVIYGYLASSSCSRCGVPPFWHWGGGHIRSFKLMEFTQGSMPYLAVLIVPIKNHWNSSSTGRGSRGPHELLYQQKSAKTCENTQCCLRLLRSKNAEPCEAQCHNSAMSTTIKSCSNINIADAFHFPLGRWQLALEPGVGTESNPDESCRCQLQRRCFSRYLHH